MVWNHLRDVTGVSALTLWRGCGTGLPPSWWPRAASSLLHVCICVQHWCAVLSQAFLANGPAGRQWAGWLVSCSILCRWPSNSEIMMLSLPASSTPRRACRPVQRSLKLADTGTTHGQTTHSLVLQACFISEREASGIWITRFSTSIAVFSQKDYPVNCHESS